MQIKTLCDELRRQKELIIAFDDVIHPELTAEKLQEDIDQISDFIMGINQAIAGSIEQPDDSVIHESNSVTQSVKLPQIQLKKFAGDPLTWTNFWDLFSVSIHSRSDVTVISCSFIMIRPKFHF